MLQEISLFYPSWKLFLSVPPSFDSLSTPSYTVKIVIYKVHWPFYLFCFIDSVVSDKKFLVHVLLHFVCIFYNASYILTPKKTSRIRFRIRFRPDPSLQKRSGSGSGRIQNSGSGRTLVSRLFHFFTNFDFRAVPSSYYAFWRKNSYKKEKMSKSNFWRL